MSLLHFAFAWAVLSLVVVLWFGTVVHRDDDELPPSERPLDLTRWKP